MLELFQKNIKENLNIPFDSKIIVAVSGGIDSMVLLHLSKLTFKTIVIAHCNFNLRGEESDHDELFVRNYARENNIEFYCKPFNTNEFAENHKISIQEAARKLRYDWFYELLHDLNFDFIALGHNKNDSIETFLFHLIRGSGIKGLSGIPEVNNQIIRPLLFAERTALAEFAQNENILFREDSSNKTTKYSRNKIRHDVIPVLREINSQAENHIFQTIEYFKEIRSIVEEKLEEINEDVIEENASIIKINIQKIISIPYKSVILFEILSSYHFNSTTIQDILASLEGESGKTFFSKTHQLVKDRDYLLITALEHTLQKEIYIDKTAKIITDPIKLIIQTIPNKAFTIPPLKNTACLDFEKLKFPLKLRNWQEGDRFIPLGMSEFKKLSDFFIDEKLSIFDKQKVQIITDSDDQIVWIIEHRIDNRFKITSETKYIYLIEFQP